MIKFCTAQHVAFWIRSPTRVLLLIARPTVSHKADHAGAWCATLRDEDVASGTAHPVVCCWMRSLTRLCAPACTLRCGVAWCDVFTGIQQMGVPDCVAHSLASLQPASSIAATCKASGEFSLLVFVGNLPLLRANVGCGC